MADDGRATDSNGSAAVAFKSSRRFIGGFPKMLFFWSTGAHFPKFVRHRSAHLHELRKAMGTSKFIDSSTAFSI
jgi:hypothetical protein